ncbi:MAG: hypothetical protein ACTSXC_01540 [Candidatus Freyarchaeota archaeon]
MSIPHPISSISAVRGRGDKPHRTEIVLGFCVDTILPPLHWSLKKLFQ